MIDYISIFYISKLIMRNFCVYFFMIFIIKFKTNFWKYLDIIYYFFIILLISKNFNQIKLYIYIRIKKLLKKIW